MIMLSAMSVALMMPLTSESLQEDEHDDDIAIRRVSFGFTPFFTLSLPHVWLPPVYMSMQKICAIKNDLFLSLHIVYNALN